MPRTVLIPVGGSLADRIGTRTVMLTADAARCCLVAGLAAAATGRVTSLAVLGPLAALLGAGEGVFIPASFAIMPSLLEPEQLQAGNAINSASVQAGGIIGPVLGGLLVATAGPAPAFAVDAASFAVSALSLTLIRPRALAPAQASPASPGGASVRISPATSTVPGSTASVGSVASSSVWSLVRRERVLQVLIVVVIAANLASGGTFSVALPALAHMSFGAGGYGALMACLGGGAVAGTLAAAAGGKLPRPALAAAACFVTEAFAMAFIPFLGGLPGAAAATFVLGAGNGLGNVIMLTLVQRWAPPQLLGRVMSLVMLCGMGSFPLSAAVSGVLVRHVGPSPFFPVAAATVTAALLLAVSRREFRDFGTPQPDVPARAGAERLELPGLTSEP